MSCWILNPCVPGSNLGNRMIFFFFFFYLFIFLCFFLSLLLQCEFANLTLLSLLSFSYFITPCDAQASSAFSALITLAIERTNSLRLAVVFASSAAKLIHPPVTQRKPARQRTTNATEINKQSEGVNTFLGTTCHGSV